MPILHWCDNGIASWYDIAVAIGEISTKNGLIKFSIIYKSHQKRKLSHKSKETKFLSTRLHLIKRILRS